MESFTKLISAFAQILWPLLGFTTLAFFRKEISEILRRIKKGKMLGQEIELADSLETLRVSAESASRESALSLPIPVQPPLDETQLQNKNDDIQLILDEASRSPKIALINLGGLIENTAKKALAISGSPKSLDGISVIDAVKKLSIRHGGLPGDILESLKLFMDVRNKIIHSREATEGDVISAIDSGLTILRTLRSIPIRQYITLHPNIPLYSDPDCKILRPGTALIMEIVGPGGFKKTRDIYPTTRTDYVKGQKLTAEWNIKTVFDQCWYIDPESGDKKSDWLSSAEFVGRPLDSI
ncbi:hypothetical protein QS468_42035 [Bacillus subtilis]|nr:hypothetical protein [Pseudomonas sp. A29(2023)]MDL5599353.1 hypothetical protein [Bacillus subtilis]